MTSPVRNESIPEDKVLESPGFHNTEHNEHYGHLLSLPHKRVRTISENERISVAQTFKGTVETFCRNKGHGFIKPDGESEPLFLHISDIEGEWAPNSGDRVSFKKILIPPKLLKYQAVHVKLIHLNQNVPHQHWEDTRQNL